MRDFIKDFIREFCKKKYLLIFVLMLMDKELQLRLEVGKGDCFISVIIDFVKILMFLFEQLSGFV